ncbi:MAG: polyprenyl diphosphate synthase [Oscillospiraceae bacterium]
MKFPKHIAIIPDGNRRWATKMGMDKSAGYSFGLSPAKQLLTLAKENKVEEITFYGFTKDNCKRPINQLKAFSHACTQAVELLQQEGGRLLVVGDTSDEFFPKELLPFSKERVQLGSSSIKINFLVNYGWQWDISGLANCSEEDIISDNVFAFLHSKDISRIDLVIRWGKMRRLSGLLPLQSVYADFYVCDNLWPDFQESDFFDALKWYNKQDITLGG